MSEPTAPTPAQPPADGDPRPDPDDAPARTAPAEDAVPDAATLERTAQPAVVRRAPRYRAFVLVGALVGLVVALLVVLLGGRGEGDGVVLVFVGGGFAVAGALLGAVVAILLDRASLRR